MIICIQGGWPATTRRGKEALGPKIPFDGEDRGGSLGKLTLPNESYKARAMGL